MRNVFCWAFLLASSVFIALFVAPPLRDASMPLGFVIRGNEI